MKEKEELLERTFYVKCSKEQLIELGNWMFDNGIEFKKMPDNIHQLSLDLVRQSECEAEETQKGDGTIRP